MSPGTHVMFTLPALVLLGSAWLIAWGWRGRRIDAHMICRRCGFDLSGLPMGVRVCSECGNDLDRRRATRFGNRRRRWRAIVVGAMPLMLSLTWFAAVAFVVVRGVDVTKHKPVWWLAREMDHAKQTTRDAAFLELRDRLRNGKLTAGHVSSLADRALAAQADARRPWHGGWGQFIEETQSVGQLPPEKWALYIEQAIRSSIVLQARKKVRRGDPLPLRIVINPARAGRTLQLLYRWDVMLGGVPAVQPDRTRRRLPMGLNALRVTSDEDDLLVHPSAYAELPDGAHEVTVIVTPFVRTGRIVQLDPVSVKARWELVPADAEVVRLIDDPALAEQVRESFQRVVLKRLYRTLHADAYIRRTGVPQAYRVVVRAQGQESHGPDLCAARGRSALLFAQIPLPDLAADRVDLIFRPSIDAAVRTVDITEIWGGEVVFKNVPVR